MSAVASKGGWERLGRPDGATWIVSQRDGAGNVVGTAVHSVRSQEPVCSTGHVGLSMDWPLCLDAGTYENPIFICYGAAEAASLLGLDLVAVGTWLSGRCPEWLVHAMQDRHVVFVLNSDPAWCEGARGLAQKVLMGFATVRVIQPPLGTASAQEAVERGATATAFLEAASATHPLLPAAPAMPFGDGAADDSADPFVPINAADLISKYTEMREVLVEGLLRRGEVMNIVAPPKQGKSWFVHGLIAAAVKGSPWLGRKTRKLRVLLIDAELHRETLADRLAAVHREFALTPSDIASIDIIFLRGVGATIDDVLRKLRPVGRGRYDLIVLDALYRFLPPGGEENSNETMTYVYNVIDAIADLCGAAVIAVHHTSKGNQSDRAVTDVGSGAGAQSRAADTHLVLRPHEEDGAVVVEAAVRSFPQMEPFVIQWNKPGWKLDSGLDPTRLKRPNPRRGRSGEKAPAAPKRTWTPKEFVDEFVGEERLIRDTIVDRARRTGMSKAQADSQFKQAVHEKHLHRDKLSGTESPVYSKVAPSAATESAAEGGGGGGGVLAFTPPPEHVARGGVGGTRATPLPPPKGRTPPQEDIEVGHPADTGHRWSGPWPRAPRVPDVQAQRVHLPAGRGARGLDVQILP